MKILVFYDVSETKNRNKLVNVLEIYGFYRVQKSVFMGNIKENKYRTFQSELCWSIALTDLLYIVPMTENSFRNIMTLGHSIHSELMVLKKNEFDFEDIIV